MGGGGVSFLLRSRVPFVCVGYDTVPGQHPHGDWARRKNLSEEDIITGEREIASVAARAGSRVPGVPPVKLCVSICDIKSAARGSDRNNNNSNNSLREAIQTNPLVILYRTDPCQVIWTKVSRSSIALPFSPPIKTEKGSDRRRRPLLILFFIIAQFNESSITMSDFIFDPPTTGTWKDWRW